MRIVIDGMGGDNAPEVEVKGAVLAAREFDFEIIITGDTPRIEKELSKYAPVPKNISIQHASEVIGMDESPVTSVRKKKDSSLNVGVNLIKDKKADAIVTAGNTGAAVCATSLFLRCLEGVDRSGIGVIFPTLKDNAILIDAGANVDPKPKDLLIYAAMGDVCSREILKKANPRVGLLNVGEEATKGPDFIKETYKLLESSNLNFIGNVEGRDIFTGKVDVIICDGFLGNVVLKVTESLAEVIGHFLKAELKRNIFTMAGALLCSSAFRALKKEIDYSEYGGAPLLGIDGICIISHGRSDAKAIKNALKVAGEFVSRKINSRIVEAAGKFKCASE